MAQVLCVCLLLGSNGKIFEEPELKKYCAADYCQFLGLGQEPKGKTKPTKSHDRKYFILNLPSCTIA